jgi:hypothetical protein
MVVWLGAGRRTAMGFTPYHEPEEAEKMGTQM